MRRLGAMPRLRRGLILAVPALAVIAAGAGAFWLLSSGSGSNSKSATRTAAILDQLDLTAPDPDFVKNATDTLQQAGYSVTYYKGDEVTVDLYRELPTHNFDLVILRVHSAPVTVHNDTTGEVTQSDFLSLFTGETYSDKYQQEQDLGRIAKSRYLRQGYPGEYVFGIVPSFVQRSMQGRFNGTPIIMMGCDGLRSQTTAQAFLDKGASDFVSWSQPVSSVHTDEATEKLMQRYLIDGEPMDQAVKNTATDVGPDPYFGGELRLLSKAKGSARSG